MQCGAAKDWLAFFFPLPRIISFAKERGRR
jgi:hypothetical protein